MRKLTKNSVIARNLGIVTADLDGETVMMSIETGKYYNLGKTGSVIWTMLETPLTVETIIGRLLDQYDVDYEQCEKEVFSFLGEMGQEGIIITE